MAKRRNNCQQIASAPAQPSDIISNLPDNVIETILMYLPTGDAVWTSILSRKWRYRWAKLPQLILDEMLSNELSAKYRPEIPTMILYQILLLHEGPIKKFTHSIPFLESFLEIDHLTFFLSRNGIEDLTLEMLRDEDDCYRLPSSFFTCQQLRHLSPSSCSIGATLDFKGFSRLITLKLYDVTISAQGLGSLISSSPLLELLELEIFSDTCDLEIDAPNLKIFSFEGIMRSIIFNRTLLLSLISIVGMDFMQVGTGNLVEFFHGLPVLENLQLNCSLIESLAAGGIPRRLLTTLVYLKDLKLSLFSLNQLDNLSFTLCLIRSSPNLRRIHIELHADSAFDPNVLEFLKEKDYSDVILNELKKVKLQNVIGIRHELELIQLLLATSQNLKKLTIQPEKQTANEGFKVLKEVTRFRRVSKEAELFFADVVENQV